MRWRRVLALVPLVALLSGCWNNAPIDSRALVLLLGIGPAPQGAIRVYFQAPTKSGLRAVVSAGGAGGSSGTAYFVVSGAGHSVADAFAAAQSRLDRDIYLGQLQMVLFSERLSGAQFSAASDALFRLGLIDKSVYVGATPSVRAALQVTPAETKLPGLYFSQMFGCKHCQTTYLGVRLWDLYAAQAAAGQSPWMPEVSPGPLGFVVDRMVIYRAGRPALTLSPGASEALGLLLGRTTKGNLTIDLPGVGRVGLRSISAQPHLRIAQQGGRPWIQESLSLEGQLEEVHRRPAPALATLLPQIQQQAARAVGARVQAVLAALQQQGLDPVGFTSAYRWRHPTRAPTATAWQAWYRRARITVVAHFRIRNSGIQT